MSPRLRPSDVDSGEPGRGSGTVDRLTSWVPALYVVLLSVGTVLVPPQAHTALVSWLSLLLLVALGVWALVRGGADRERLIVSGVALVPLLVVFARSLTAPNPWVSVFGMAGQHSSVAAWWVTWACLALVMFAGKRSDLRPLFIAASLTGAVFGVLAAAEALGVAEFGARFSPEPAAFFDSSISLAQYLVLALGCAVGLGFSGKRLRWLGWASTAFIAAGIVSSTARASWVGVLVGTAVFVLLAANAMPRRALLRPLALGVLATSAAAYVLALVAAVGLLGSQAYDLADAMLTGRLHVWEVALGDVAAAPLLGSGPSHFGAVAAWSVGADRLVAPQFTGVPHSALFWWGTAVGLVGVVAVCGTAWFVGRELAGSIRATGPSLAAAAAGAGLAAWATTVLFSWTNPLAMATAGLLAGALLSSGGRAVATGVSESEKRRSALAGRVVAVAIVVASAVLAAAFYAEAFYEVRTAAGDADAAELAVHLESTRDPTYAQLAIERLIRAAVADPEVASQAVGEATIVAGEWEDDAEWNLSLAYNRMEAAWVGYALTGAASWEDVLVEVEAAEAIDPATGVFSYWAAVNAAASGQPEEARRLAERSLDLEPTPEAEALLEALQ